MSSLGRRLRRVLGCLVVGVLALALVVGGWFLVRRLQAAQHSRPAEGRVASVAGSAAAETGGFGVRWDAEALRLDVVSRHSGRMLWSTVPGRAFVGAGDGVAAGQAVEESRGSFFLHDRRLALCGDQTVEGLSAEGDLVTLRGLLDCPEREPVPWVLRFQAETSADGEGEGEGEGDRLRFVLHVGVADLDRTFLTLAVDPDERVFGGGVQFSRLDLRGERLPILVQEQGIGRGAQPITLGADLTAKAGGTWWSTYAPVPHVLTSGLRSLALAGSEVSFVDLRTPGTLQIETWSGSLDGRIFGGDTPTELIAAYTAWSGRMRPLPGWLHDGAVVGMQGGTSAVRAKLATLRAAGTPVSAVWLQDWVGQRTTSFGQQLWWNWVLDEERYPGWDELVADLEADGTRVLTYVNPFLVDVSGRDGWNGRNLYLEAAAEGFLVLRGDGTPYLVQNTDFSAGLLDLTNPRAVAWFENVLRDEVLGVGAAGWMADFAEGLPFDAALHSGQDPASMHNRWPELWAEVNRRAIERADRPGAAPERFFFTRSGYTRSPGASTLFWLGDQMVSWDAHDGLESAVTGLLSSGLSGFSLQHSDIGGYTTITHPIQDIHRSAELLARWAELAAFTVVYRSHEGNLPGANVQPWTSPETSDHFARFARVYAGWSVERRRLVDEASATGLPVVRHPWLCAPDDPASVDLRRQIMVGCDLVMAPVLAPGAESLAVHLPPGRWTHLWSGEVHEGPLDLVTSAPLGEPAVFVREGSRVAMELASAVDALR